MNLWPNHCCLVIEGDCSPVLASRQVAGSAHWEIVYLSLGLGISTLFGISLYGQQVHLCWMVSGSSLMQGGMLPYAKPAKDIDRHLNDLGMASPLGPVGLEF